MQEHDLPRFYRRFVMTHAEPIFIDVFRPIPCPSLRHFIRYFDPGQRPLWTLGPADSPSAYFALHHIQREHGLANLDFAFFTGCPAPGSVQAGRFWQAVCSAAHQWGLTRLQSFVLAVSAEKIRLLESVGCRREGLLREHCFHDGRLHDLAVHGYLAGERDG